MLTEKTLKASIESGSLLPVYIIAGEDIYLKRQALDRIIKATVEPDDEMNLIKYEYGVDLQEVYDEINGFPLMADRKCVVLKDFDTEDADKTEFEKLLALASEPCETTVFVIYFGSAEPDLIKSAKFKKLVSAAEGAGGAFVKLDYKTPEELVRWLSASAKKQGCLLSPQNARYITEICSLDISVLTRELTKLCTFVGSGEITKEVIDKVCVKSVEAEVWDLSKKVLAGDSAGALNLLDELYYMNIEPIVIFYSISSAYVDMYRAFCCKAEGKNPEAMGDAFGLGKRGFVLSRAAGNLRRFDKRKLDISLDAIVKTERELKSYSGNDRAAIEKLIVRLIYIMKTGEALD